MSRDWCAICNDQTGNLCHRRADITWKNMWRQASSEVTEDLCRGKACPRRDCSLIVVVVDENGPYFRVYGCMAIAKNKEFSHRWFQRPLQCRPLCGFECNNNESVIQTIDVILKCYQSYDKTLNSLLSSLFNILRILLPLATVTPSNKSVRRRQSNTCCSYSRDLKTLSHFMGSSVSTSFWPLSWGGSRALRVYRPLLRLITDL